MERLNAYSWPGNIRELQSVIKQALLRASGTVLLPGFLPALRTDASSGAKESTGALPDLDAFIREQIACATDDIYAETHRRVDKLLLTRALEHTGGNQREAARLLGISRQTMRTKLRSLGLTVSHALEIEDGTT
jgi:two-component system nitrogen regulation response regulator GlnG